jgi:acetate kinase
MRTRSWRPLDAETYLSTHGGLRALSGTPDLRLVIEAAARCEHAAVQALEHYVSHLATAVAAAAVALGGIDSLVFTATAGERSSFLRARVAERLAFLGVSIDEAKNEQAHSKDAIINTHAVQLRWRLCAPTKWVKWRSLPGRCSTSSERVVYSEYEQQS